MSTVKITRDGKESEIDSRYVQDFLDDGWKKVDDKKSKSQRAKELKEQNEEEREEQQEQDEILGEMYLEQEEADARAHARIEAENREKELRDQAEAKAQAEAAMVEAVRKHELKIQALEDKEAVVDYVKENFDEDLDKRGSLETVKEKAKAVANESKRVD